MWLFYVKSRRLNRNSTLDLALGIVFDLGAHGVWYGLAGGLTGAAVLLTYRYYRNLRKLERNFNTGKNME